MPNVLANRSMINTTDWGKHTHAQLNGHMTQTLPLRTNTESIPISFNFDLHFVCFVLFLPEMTRKTTCIVKNLVREHRIDITLYNTVLTKTTLAKNDVYYNVLPKL